MKIKTINALLSTFNNTQSAAVIYMLNNPEKSYYQCSKELGMSRNYCSKLYNKYQSIIDTIKKLQTK